MNDEMTNLDQIDEEILTYTASDEALEAAAVGTLASGGIISLVTPAACGGRPAPNQAALARIKVTRHRTLH